MADNNTITDEMRKKAQRASGIGFINQLVAGPPVDDQPMTTERAGALLKRAYGYLAAKDQRVLKVYKALSAA